MTCPTCGGTGGAPDEACCACGGAGELQCMVCGGSGTRPAPGSPAAWDRARILQVVSLAWPGHAPSLELLDLGRGRRALRFAAYADGEPVAGPLVLEEAAIEHLARALAGTSIQPMIARLASLPAEGPKDPPAASGRRPGRARPVTSRSAAPRSAARRRA
jgi:hypothetical protein